MVATPTGRIRLPKLEPADGSVLQLENAVVLNFGSTAWLHFSKQESPAGLFWQCQNALCIYGPILFNKWEIVHCRQHFFLIHDIITVKRFCCFETKYPDFYWMWSFTMLALSFCLELRIMTGKLQFPSEKQHKCFLQSRSNTDNGWRKNGEKMEKTWKN